MRPPIIRVRTARDTLSLKKALEGVMQKLENPKAGNN
jgi:hypothetical protein